MTLKRPIPGLDDDSDDDCGESIYDTNSDDSEIGEDDIPERQITTHHISNSDSDYQGNQQLRDHIFNSNHNNDWSGFFLHANPDGPNSGETQNTLSLHYERIFEALGGYPPHESVCYGCTQGRYNSVATSYNGWRALTRLFEEQHNMCDEIELTKQLYQFFEARIRIPANNAASLFGEELLPEWSPAGIYSHFWIHLGEPSVVIQRMANFCRRACFNMEVNTLCYRKKNAQGVIIEKFKASELDKILKCQRQYVMLVNQKPAKMVGANPGLNLNESKVSPINTNGRSFYKRGVKSNLAIKS